MAASTRRCATACLTTEPTCITTTCLPSSRLSISRRTRLASPSEAMLPTALAASSTTTRRPSACCTRGTTQRRCGLCGSPQISTTSPRRGMIASSTYTTPIATCCSKRRQRRAPTSKGARPPSYGALTGLPTAPRSPSAAGIATRTCTRWATVALAPPTCVRWGASRAPIASTRSPLTRPGGTWRSAGATRWWRCTKWSPRCSGGPTTVIAAPTAGGGRG
mmetsp:Transcript_86503/g.259532  ORF Transcript_86503/g.259532 Transcript_86503/m.259532 type:complete len:220 (-) Transcript_86503:357-1016(-)